MGDLLDYRIPYATYNREFPATPSVGGALAQRAEAELRWIAEESPEWPIGSCCEAAILILKEHLEKPRGEGLIRVRVKASSKSGEWVEYRVTDFSSGLVYRVDPRSWCCSCQDISHCSPCEHALAAWALSQALGGCWSVAKRTA